MQLHANSEAYTSQCQRKTKTNQYRKYNWFEYKINNKTRTTARMYRCMRCKLRTQNILAQRKLRHKLCNASLIWKSYTYNTIFCEFIRWNEFKRFIHGMHQRRKQQKTAETTIQKIIAYVISKECVKRKVVTNCYSNELNVAVFDWYKYNLEQCRSQKKPRGAVPFP